ncbi:MAG: hypothetical protein H2056_05605 [Sphingopyxis sp.]|nr:hypothetical protein [Sphingopyxis sp.]
MRVTRQIADTARAVVAARAAARPLQAFPGVLPETLDEAYAIQLAAIALWNDRIAGWMVGRLSADLAQRFGTDRFIGPIFAAQVTKLGPDVIGTFPAFAGGSAAFEAEFVAFAGPGTDRAAVVHRLTTGIEVATSPVAPLPLLGSLASVADLGNNGGILIGGDVPLGRIGDPVTLVCVTTLDDDAPVRAAASALPGGPQAAFDFTVRQTEALGLPLTEGQFVSTGAVTGMHAIRPGQRCTADFRAFGVMACVVTARRQAGDEGTAA